MCAAQLLELETVRRGGHDHHRRQDRRIVEDQDRAEEDVHGDLFDPLESGETAAEEFGIRHPVAQARNTQADAAGHGVHQLQDAGK